jgi:cyclopropane-fatty-acyl-phospholipid synthase
VRWRFAYLPGVTQAADRCGGHTLTDTTSSPPVDLGFQVFNLSTYPHFVELLHTLGVESEPSDMSFSLSVDDGRLEWASHSLTSVFAQPRNAISPGFWRMLMDVRRFGNEAPSVLDSPECETMSLGDYLNDRGYSHEFVHQYMLPMTACIWSAPNATALDFPVRTLVRFWVNHHLLHATAARPVWRVVKNRSQSYVDKILAVLPDVRTNTPVVAVQRGAGVVVVHDGHGGQAAFEHIVFACHSDQALACLGAQASADERSVLERIRYQISDVYLHSDPSLMPRASTAWASWNCREQSGASDNNVSVTYWLNRLQNLPPDAPNRFCTLNPRSLPRGVIRQLKLSHPMLDRSTVAAQGRIPLLQGCVGLNTWFCGAWCGYGFHEDGLQSAIDVCRQLGVTVPWQTHAVSPVVTLTQSVAFRMFDRVAALGISTGSLRMILPDGSERRYGSVAPAAGPHVSMRVFDMQLWVRLSRDDDIGLGEGYMAGDFAVNDLSDLLSLVTLNARGLAQGGAGGSHAHRLLNWAGTQVQRMRHGLRANTVRGSRRNITEHYDLVSRARPAACLATDHTRVLRTG